MEVTDVQPCVSSEKHVAGYLAHLPNEAVVSVVYGYTLVKVREGPGEGGLYLSG